MKKLFLGYLLASILLVSCAKSTDTKLISKKHELPTIKKERYWQYIIGGIIIVILETTGQKTTTTTTVTNQNGTTTTTVTSCDGLGLCAGSLCVPSNTGNDLISLDVNDQSMSLHTDIRVNAKLAVTKSNDIILLVENNQNPQSIMNKFFYGEYKYFFPESYTVNNPEVLEALGLNSPFVIQGANYPVYSQENMKYIIVGHKS